MGITIEKIQFENYRQYSNATLHFRHDDSGKLSIIIAKNGIGKTTLLNAITWCFYGEELHLSDKYTALPIINTASIDAADDGAIIPVSVTVTVVDEKDTIEFKRSTRFIVKKSEDGQNAVIPDNPILTVATTPLGAFLNTQIKTGPDADMVVTQYFARSISQFYFFDGEKLRDFFSKGYIKSIKDSIFSISQIHLLRTACERLQKMQSDKTRRLGKSFPDLADLQQEKERLVISKNKAEELFETQSIELEKYKRKQAELDEKLRNYEPIKKLQEERMQREAELKNIEDEEKKWKERRAEFILKNIKILGLFPQIRHARDLIARKEEEGGLPPSIDKMMIKALLEHPNDPCPICDAKIGETGRQHLEHLLEKISVSSRTSNYLMEIKGELERYYEEASQYKVKKEELLQASQDISNRQHAVAKRLTEINSSLSSYESRDDKINVAELEKARADVSKRIITISQTLGGLKNQIDTNTTDIENITEKIEEVVKKIQEHNGLKQQRALLERIQRYFESFKENITGVMRQEIERKTWDIFDKMIWKRNTFGQIKMSDEYEVAVYNKEDCEMTGSLSATEQMALAYAFTLAIHEASGKNCPLVIDSPLGRVSDENRENMANVLMDISKNKQIIMLFTPDEYSESVKKIYENNAEIKSFSLSVDEKYVKGVD